MASTDIVPMPGAIGAELVAKRIDAFFEALRARSVEVMEALKPMQDPLPFAFTMRTDGGLSCYALDTALFANAAMKDVLAEVLQSLAEKDNAIAFAFISAGWILRGDSRTREEFDALTKHVNRVGVKNLEGRVECVVMHEFRAGVGRIHLAEIVRHENAAPTLNAWKTDDRFDGRFLAAIEPVMRRNFARLYS